MLTLTGLGDAIKGQRLSLSQFYNITVRNYCFIMIISSTLCLFVHLYVIMGSVTNIYLHSDVEYAKLVFNSSSILQVGPGSILQAPLDDEENKNA